MSNTRAIIADALDLWLNGAIVDVDQFLDVTAKHLDEKYNKRFLVHDAGHGVFLVFAADENEAKKQADLCIQTSDVYEFGWRLSDDAWVEVDAALPRYETITVVS